MDETRNIETWASWSNPLLRKRNLSFNDHSAVCVNSFGLSQIGQEFGHNFLAKDCLDPGLSHSE